MVGRARMDVGGSDRVGTAAEAGAVAVVARRVRLRGVAAAVAAQMRLGELAAAEDTERAVARVNPLVQVAHHVAHPVAVAALPELPRTGDSVRKLVEPRVVHLLELEDVARRLKD